MLERIAQQVVTLNVVPGLENVTNPSARCIRT
jgi:hypothetical protein